MSGRFVLRSGPEGQPVEGTGEVLDLTGDRFEALGRQIAAGSPEDLYVGWFGHDLETSLWMRTTGWVVSPDAAARLLDHPDEPSRSVEQGAERPSVETPPAEYVAAFEAVQERLHAGDSYEVNLTYRRQVRSSLTPEDAFVRLCATNPAPYAGLITAEVDGTTLSLVSASPERFLRVEGRTVETKPIKGTTPRGATSEEDEVERVRLATDPKFRAENLMITDLLRNDLATVCEVGSVEVPHLMEVESYASVHQLVTTVRGRLRDGVGTVDAVRALFPPGSMTGAPKLRTMEIIDAVETTPRGVYSGVFGWIRGDGSADLAVVIRSLTSDGSGVWELGTGGGITVDSTVEDEWAEAELKAARLMAALAE